MKLYENQFYDDNEFLIDYLSKKHVSVEEQIRVLSSYYGWAAAVRKSQAEELWSVPTKRRKKLTPIQIEARRKQKEERAEMKRRAEAFLRSEGRWLEL